MPLRRDRLTNEVGPDASGSKPGIECTQMPEKSGMDLAPSLPLLADPIVGATVCPKAGAATIAARAATKSKFRCCKFMVSSVSLTSPGRLSDNATPVITYVTLSGAAVATCRRKTGKTTVSKRALHEGLI